MSNPYIAGIPLRATDPFFGREEMIEWVMRTLASPNRRECLITGQRRIGKTSLLRQLEGRLRESHLVPVFVDLQAFGRSALSELLRHLAAKIAESASDNGSYVSLGDLDFDERTFRRELLPRLLEPIPDNRGVVLLLDEVDALDEFSQDSPNSSPPHPFFPFLRELLESDRRFRYVAVVGRQVARLRVGAMSVFRTAEHRRIALLDSRSAEALVRLAEQQGTLRFENQAIERILTLTSGHPYLIQLICQTLFDQIRGRGGEADQSSVSVDDVEQNIPRVVEAADLVLRYIWDSVSAPERIVFSAISQATANGSAIDANQIFENLTSHGLTTLIYGELTEAPSKLVEMEMLKESTRGYVCAIELMQIWARQEQPLARLVKTELDRVSPEAQIYFDSAKRFADQGHVDSAFNQVRAAVQSNPRHIGARLLMADLLRKKEDVRGALEHYERAQRDATQLEEQSRAKYGLLGCYILLAQELEKPSPDESRDERETQALGYVDRVLKIAPNEREAVLVKRRIWQRRGDQSLKAGALEDARKAFETADNIGRLQEVDQIIRNKRREELIQQSETSVSNKDWATAAHCYKELLALDSANENWRHQEWLCLRNQADQDEEKEDWPRCRAIYDALINANPEKAGHWRLQLERVEHSAQRSEKYRTAIAAHSSQDWTHAQQLFVELVVENPDYMDCAARLAESVQQARRSATAGQLLQRRLTVEQASQLAPQFRLGRGIIYSLQWSPDGRWLAAATSTGVLLFRHSYQQLSINGLECEHTPAARSVCISHDGRLVLAGGEDGKVRVYAWEQSTVLHELSVGNEPVTDVSLDERNGQLATCCMSGVVKIWRTTDWQLDREIGTREKNIRSLTYLPGQPCLALGLESGLITLVNTLTGIEIQKFEGHRDWVQCLACSSQQKLLASGSDDQTVRLWNYESQNSFATLSGHSRRVRTVTFSPDGLLLASGGDDCTVRIWDPKKGRQLLCLGSSHARRVNRVTFHPDQSFLASASDDGTILLFS